MPQGNRYNVQAIMGNRVRYCVPSFYQRAYVWTLEKQWADLWEDIRRKAAELLLARDKEVADPSVRQKIANHFMGAFVVNAVTAYGFYPPRKDVIDGQQRLTTVQLLLHAFQHVAARRFGAGDQTVLELQTLTHNSNATDEHEFKVWPTEADQNLLLKLMSAESKEAVFAKLGIEPSKSGKFQKSTGLDGAYFYFHDEISDFLEKDEAGNPLDDQVSRRRAYALYEVIAQRMDLVMIELDDNDDPQVIFEALNGRGTPLLPSDLIKNHVFERLRPLCPDQNPMPLYKQYWSHFDTLDDEAEENEQGEPQKFWKVEVRQGRLTRPRIDLFLFHYLQYKDGQEVLISELFREFKEWWVGQPNGNLQAATGNLADIQDHSAIFQTFLTATGGDSVKDRLWHLRSIDTSTIYPVLLFLFAEAEKPSGKVGSTALPQLLADIESFLVRRQICGLTGKNYNNIFMKLLADLRKMEIVDATAIGRLLAAGDGPTNSFPKDDEFRRAWVSRAIYAPSLSTFINMLLAAINEHMRTDAQEQAKIKYDGLWVEHVMPQKWKQHWQLADPGGEHHKDPGSGIPVSNQQWRDRMVNTMGNLTLLTSKLNARISNGPYENADEDSDKRREYRKHAILRITHEISSKEGWDEAAIVRRAEDMFEHAVQIWRYPEA